MSPEEKHYYQERASIERRCAEDSTNPHVAEIHRKLAALYEHLVDLDQPPTLRLVDERTAAQA